MASFRIRIPETLYIAFQKNQTERKHKDNRHKAAVNYLSDQSFNLCNVQTAYRRTGAGTANLLFYFT